MSSEVPSGVRPEIWAQITSLSGPEVVHESANWNQNKEKVYDHIWERCKKDIHYWVFTFARAVNLHMEAIVEDGEETPGESVDLFPDYTHVRMVLDALKDPKNILIDKSRDMMCTWSL